MHSSLPSATLPVITSSLETAVISDQAAFDALAEDWGKLFESCAGVSAFQSFVWNQVTWRHCPPGLSLTVITVREEGRLVGVGPFVAERRLGVERIQLIGFDQYAYLGPLVPPGRDDVAQAMAAAFAERFPRGLLHVPYFQCRDEGLAVMLARLGTLGWSSCSWARNVCHYLCESEGYEKFLAKKSSKVRYNLKRERKKLEETGAVDIRLYEGAAIDESVVERISAIQKRSWLFRRGQEPLGSPYYRELLPALGRLRLADVYLMTHGGKDVAFVLNYHTGRENLCSCVGFDEALAQLSPGKAMMNSVVKTILDRGDHVVDFLFGDAEYKQFWASRSKFAMELVAWKGAAANVQSWFPARLRAWVKRHPRMMENLKSLRRLPRRLFGAGAHGAPHDTPPPVESGTETQAKRDGE
jgi:CelD/BcsL family acetyltransferase involved in cellulose biosynthesis